MFPLSCYFLDDLHRVFLFNSSQRPRTNRAVLRNHHSFLQSLGCASRTAVHAPIEDAEVYARRELVPFDLVPVTLLVDQLFLEVGLACGLAAAAGVLIGPMQSVQVEMGYLMLMKAFAAAVVGGFGSLPGAIVGGIMVGIFENLGAAYISASHKDIYAFLLLILVLMFKPSGLFGVEAKVKA